jgi:ABC-type transport system involved in multi-copper enzyme maturation permease subunit
MSELLHAELIKLRTTRTFVAIAGAAIATSLLVAVLVALLTEPTEETVLVDVFASDTSSFFILLLAVIGISGEWRHRTISSALLAAPDRRRFLAAKAIAFAVAGLALSLLVAAAVTVTGVAVLAARGLPLPDVGELAGQVGRNALLAAMLGAFGVAIGGIVRNQIVAVVTLLVVMFLVEPIVVALAPSVGRFGPLGALSVAAAGIPAEDAGLGDVQLVGTATAVLLLLAWIALAFAAATALLQRRDVE